MHITLACKTAHTEKYLKMREQSRGFPYWPHYSSKINIRNNKKTMMVEEKSKSSFIYIYVLKYSDEIRKHLMSSTSKTAAKYGHNFTPV